MKIAFVVQRYGAEILGGSEYHCRLIAERLAGRHQVDVLTTCARDYITWKNEYPEGEDRIRGVTVRRFANDRTRDLASFNEYSDWIFHNDHSPADEQEWLKQQGPWCPGLLAYLEQHHRAYDALIFFTYLYAPTVLGLQVDPARSILVPTAHDEPAIRLGLYREVFSLPAGIAYNTSVERGFLKQLFSVGAKNEETVGCGVELPPSRLHDQRAGEPATPPPPENPEAAEEGAEQTGQPNRDASDDNGVLGSPLSARGAVFRRRHRLFGPFALYGGRIDPGKGCEELLDYFNSYAESNGDASLVLMGIKLMPIPDAPHVRFAGMLSETERIEALEAATVVVVPSPFESLSLLALEAFSVGTPVLANARSDVLADHCQRSNGGLYYGNRDEFSECLRLLIHDAPLRAAMGRQGRHYVRTNYRWDVIVGKYDRLIAGLQRSRPTGRSRRSRRGGKNASSRS
ncbi:MAG: hypothetical protein CL477_15010 [Acidobacteria bacterium]|nr:hypothetical protein [Acidobacteriota bacterium]HJN42952.1 glycosyltransferase family 4 protein [Vicinamibacterales bacterium]